MKKEIKTHWHTWVFMISLGVTLIVIYKAIDSIGYIGIALKNFISVISPFLAGLLLAYLIYIPERNIEKVFQKSKLKFFRKNKRKFGITITYIFITLIIVLIVNFILPVLRESTNEFVNNVQIYYTKVLDTYNQLPSDSILKKEEVYSALKEMQNFDLKQYLSIERITEYVKGAVGLATGIFDVFVTLIVSIYILAERDQILDFFKKLSKAVFKKEKYKYIEKYFYNSNGVFFKFITSQFLDAIVVGILATIAMKIIGVKYAILLGFTIGLFNMIPYFGAIIAVIIAGIITMITGGFSQAIIMLIVVIILQQIDANIINPKIIGDSLKISPLLVIFAVTVGGAYFGVIGMFLGVPVIAVLKILVNDYIDNQNEL